ncbi:gluconokinase [Maribacter halichondriae]|uniref:gluconokinase n=1 Tax=Maribacter halichondriae TaxID=2980554 RepID=UPI0023594019|nr:gluconokinase [Maribacter sp. Hal144]
MIKNQILIVMGVSGCGKSTIGKMLAHTLGVPFYDGDDYHSEKNVEKMSQGHPLNDDDRKSWLQTLNRLAKDNLNEGTVICCSALKERYRALLNHSIEQQMIFVYLDGTYEEIFERMQKRKDHFMPPGLLKSQFDTLEPPIDAIRVSIAKQPKEITSEILSILNKK